MCHIVCRLERLANGISSSRVTLALRLLSDQPHFTTAHAVSHGLAWTEPR